ncbi:MAG TPA: DUF4872 domain-containing protein [Blastocatellia bacterium]|nr:DUF4872 domain-containing protein [Blastocatellia bacterium]HMX26353.1 DUF4872 domain-containing protein [Blastocatellia bacterium]HMY71898.1 DUF4872 domain-containing protein [Blastocatellia bacterium]HMZ20554.1 DUF4872 domain-containing protein [Blastocatellia bacterium]HNG32765.1 DUF4872 domain-containing protein [Blastocatellia bacterium]
MTAQKHLKQLIRARMAKTGEHYTTARRHIIGKLEQAKNPSTEPSGPLHFPGNVPATTALRILLANQGVRAPHTGEPFSEAMLFGIAGGIGIGVFSFYYEKEDLATFFIAGRHQWHDDEAYLRGALERFHIEPIIRETAGAKAADQQLQKALEQQGPCVAWVDAAELPHRAMPIQWSGGGYHVVVVHGLDRESDTALIGDLTNDPISIPLADLARARARIKKQKHRLLSVAPESAGKALPNLGDLVRGGLQHCHDGLLHPTLPGAKNNGRLEALEIWAKRLHGSKEKESWERVFRPGPNLWRGLCSIHDFIEHYGTGGGLCRPLFADFLSEAAAALSNANLATLSEQYAELGRAWSELADAALPSDIPAFLEAKTLQTRKAELLHDGAPAEDVRAIRRRLDGLAKEARERFPLSNADCADLREQLQTRILNLYEREVAALAATLKAIP